MQHCHVSVLEVHIKITFANTINGNPLSDPVSFIHNMEKT